MPKQERTTVQVRVRELKSSLAFQAEPQITLYLTHSEITDQTTRCYRYDPQTRSVYFDEHLLIDITGLHLTKHKYALLSLYLKKAAGRRQLLGTVPLHILKINAQGILEQQVTSCIDDNATLLMQLNVKTYGRKQMENLFAMNEGKLLQSACRQKQNQVDLLYGQSLSCSLQGNVNGRRSNSKILTRQIKSNIISKQVLASSYSKSNLTACQLDNLRQTSKLDNSIAQRSIDSGSRLQLQSKLIPQAHRLSINSQVLQVDENFSTKQERFTITAQLCLKHLSRQASVEADNSFLSKVERPTEYSFMEESVQLPKRQHLQIKDQLLQKCKVLELENKQLETQYLELVRQLEGQRRLKQLRKSEQSSYVEENKELREYICQLEGELQRMQKFISEKNNLYNACLQQILRLVSENQKLKTVNATSTQTNSQDIKKNYRSPQKQTQRIKGSNLTPLRTNNKILSTASSLQKTEELKLNREVITPFSPSVYESQITAYFNHHDSILDGRKSIMLGEQAEEAQQKPSDSKPKIMTQKFKVWKNMYAPGQY